MQPLRISNGQAASLALQEEIRRSVEARYDHRLHAVLLVCQGQSCAAVAAWLGENPATVQRWVHRFAGAGLDGLREGQRAGRPRRLAAPAWQKAEDDLRRPPPYFGYDQTDWDGKLLAQHLRQRYDVRLGHRQCQRLLLRLSSRRLEP